jgi:P27 family predicted phage terminase small subunit
MGLRGPAPQPTAIRQLNGNPGRRPLNEREPKPPMGEPRMPKGLGRRARAEWRTLSEQLLQMGVLAEVDGVALGLLCTDIAELERVQGDLGRTGYLIKNPGTNRIRVNPLVQVVSDLSRRVLVGLREFGLSPASRSRVETTPGFNREGDSTLTQMSSFLRARNQA